MSRGVHDNRRLRFPLLADFEPKGAVAKLYGAYREEDGTSERALFVIDRDGIITWSYLSPIGVNPGADGDSRRARSPGRKESLMSKHEGLFSPVTAADHIQGDAAAPVTLVEYGDYECSYCGQAYPIVKQLQARLGAAMRFVFRNFPLAEIHPACGGRCRNGRGRPPARAVLAHA